METLYHALRVAFTCGEKGVPWIFMLHAIREGIDSPYKTYRLQEKDYNEYPILRELVEMVRKCPNINEVGKWLEEAPKEAVVPLLVRLMLKHGVRWPQ